MQTRSGGRNARPAEGRAGDAEKPDPSSLMRQPIKSSRSQKANWEAVKDSKAAKVTLNDSTSVNKSRGDTTFNDDSLTERTPQKTYPIRRKGKQNLGKLGESSATLSNKSPRPTYRENSDHGDSDSASERDEEDSEDSEIPPALDVRHSFAEVTEKMQSSRTVQYSHSDDYQKGQSKYEDKSFRDEQYPSTVRSRLESTKQNFQFRAPPDYQDQQTSNRIVKNNRNVRDEYSFSDEDEPIPASRQGFQTGQRDFKRTSSFSDGKLLIIFLILVLLLSGAALFWFWPSVILFLEKLSTQKATDNLQVTSAFRDGFRKLPVFFPGQSQNLWHRSQRILELHLSHGKENKEPAIILLTAARDAEQMLQCVGNQLAKTYASSLNSSYTVLSGLDKSSEDSEKVKIEIDKKLSDGFQGTTRAAVLHRVELLPPGSLLILYKYCDHENAAFKNVALVLTVLLKNSTLTHDVELGELEETVYDFFKETFISSKSRTSHDQMDGDKLGGVWSRISHVVLPVFPEKSIVKECEGLENRP